MDVHLEVKSLIHLVMVGVVIELLLIGTMCICMGRWIVFECVLCRRSELRAFDGSLPEKFFMLGTVI